VREGRHGTSSKLRPTRIRRHGGGESGWPAARDLCTADKSTCTEVILL